MNRPPDVRRAACRRPNRGTSTAASAKDSTAVAGAAKPFIVECIRDDGTRRLYMRYATWKEAFHCAACLCAHGLPAEARDEREPGEVTP